MVNSRWSIVGLVLIGVAGCYIFPVVREAPSFTALRDVYFVRHLELNPVTATYVGADGYSSELNATNGKLRDYSEKALTEELAFYRQIQQQLLAIDRTQLEPALRVDYQLMDAQLTFLIHLIGENKYP